MGNQKKKQPCKAEADQIDRIKSKIGIGNNGKLMGRKNKKKDEDGDEKLSPSIKKLRERWYKFFRE